MGIDFGGTDWRFLESTGFLLAVLALAVLSYGLERSGANRSAELGSDTEGAAGADDRRSRSPLELAFAALSVLLGALLFAGSLAEGGEPAWPGLIGGALCAGAAYAAVGGLFERARRRLESGAAALLVVYAEAIALGLAVVAVVVPPASFVAIAAFLLLLVSGRRAGERKYAGLRALR